MSWLALRIREQARSHTSNAALIRICMSATHQERPDPDALLARVQQEEQAALRGKLRIYFGSNAGVGKTCAMLAAAQREVALGRDLLAGVVESHGRTETAELLHGLEQLPRAALLPREFALSECARDAALRRPPAWCWWTNWPTATCPAHATPNAGKTWKNCSAPASMSGPPSTSNTWKA